MSSPTPVQDRFADPTTHNVPTRNPAQEASSVEVQAGASSMMPAMPDPIQVFFGPGYQAPKPPTNPQATVALYMATFASFLFPLLPVALVLSVIALLKASANQGVGRQQARGAFVVSLIFICVWTGYLLLYYYT